MIIYRLFQLLLILFLLYAAYSDVDKIFASVLSFYAGCKFMDLIHWIDERSRAKQLQKENDLINQINTNDVDYHGYKP